MTDRDLSFPGRDEALMLRSIAVSALIDACRDGFASATFHGYAVRARRLALGRRRIVPVELTITRGVMLIEYDVGSIAVE